MRLTRLHANLLPQYDGPAHRDYRAGAIHHQYVIATIQADTGRLLGRRGIGCR
jgi:hypothetical protein